ncbi:hypothetical protein TIFTF001_015260 [Ficus carica]|uniref:BED-type domain-containing protein n=1 Tax=Ficus carica TaxID=3494 RepID=A0AA87ZYC2_FICCA|nr:hypothetical protein TIFTF001_015260 [Ficus carica]
MDDRDIEEVEISSMEAGDNVPEIRRRSFNTPIPPSPMLASSRSSWGGTNCPPKKSKGTATRTTSRPWQFFDAVQKEYFGPDGKKIQTRIAKCKYCQKTLTANSSSGTRHLLAHGEKYAEKHYKGREPTQSTLKFNSDGSVDFASTYSLTFNNTKCKLFEIFASYQNKFGQQVNIETEETLPTAVFSESAFSTAGGIIEDRRTSLTPEMVEVLTCLKDWEHADKRLQYAVEDQEILQHFNEMTIIDDDDIDNALAAPSSGC